MASNNEQQQYAEQINVLQERFPNVPQDKFARLLRRFHGDVEQVGSRLAQRDARENKLVSLEERYASVIATLQQEYPGIPRIRLLRIVERFNGDIEQTRQRLQNVHERHHERHHELHHERREHHCHGRRERREELQTKYANQLAELSSNGINTKSPWILRLLERNDGDVKKVSEIIARHKEHIGKHAEMETKYASQIAELQASGIEIKNPRILARLLNKADGQVDVVKQLINERKEKHQLRKEYRQKHRSKSAHEEGGEQSVCRKRRDFSVDDLENLKRLRSAGVHGHPKRILELFHECNDSIELTIARREEEREERCRNRQERFAKRQLLNDVQNAYVTINNREDWPADIEQVYLDGNNMMFVVDSLRRLCLNRAGKKTERAIGEIASAWNEKMHIPNVDLVFDSTRQLEPIGTVKISSAQPKYKTTDDMLIEIARQPSNQQKNKRTIIVTSDRALAALLQREGCILVKPYNWFAHCVMVLSPDLIDYEEITGLATSAETPTTIKTRYNFDQLVQRFANIDL